MFFLRFLAKSTHLQLLSHEDYQKLTKEMPTALDALCGNVKDNLNVPTIKGKFSFSFIHKRNLRSLTKDNSFLNDRAYENLDIGKQEIQTLCGRFV
jgi:hypothetical protein